MDYKKAGVDIEAGYKSVELMKEHIKGTMRKEVLTNIGGFSGAFSMESFKNMEKPTLVSGTDGVGTKLKLAFLLDKHDTIGIDCVAMCVNDIACAGGEPLFFLDYIACGKNEPQKIATIVSGVAEGCKQSNAALIGGETAEMPGFYPVDEYDLAGFAVGVVDEKDLITGKDLKAKDVIIGIASSGIHSNGYSLVRKVFSMNVDALNTYYESLGKTLGETLLTPTKGEILSFDVNESYKEYKSVQLDKIDDIQKDGGDNSKYKRTSFFENKDGGKDTYKVGSANAFKVECKGSFLDSTGTLVYSTIDEINHKLLIKKDISYEEAIYTYYIICHGNGCQCTTSFCV